MTHIVSPIISYDAENDVFVYDAKFYLVDGHWCADMDGEIVCGDMQEEDKKIVDEFMRKMKGDYKNE